MSFTLLVDILTHVAKNAAKTLPKTEAGALPAQIEIFGWGATTLGQQAQAASHQESVEITTIAAVLGLGAGILLTPYALSALGIAATGTAGALMFEAAVSVALAGISGSIIEELLEQVAEAVDDYKNGDALGLKALADEYGWPPGGYSPDPGIPDSSMPDWAFPGGALFKKSPTVISPLILDLDGDGIETTAMGYGAQASTVYFDLDNDGFAERTGWVTGGDGLLAWDQNSNGVIDNQSELFGNSSSHADGFAHLATLDTNSDNKITSADANWANLRVWVDANGDGITDAGELKTLASLNITEISLNATALTNTYNNENLVSDTSTFVIGGQTRTVSDVWFRNDNVDSRFTGDVTLIEDVFYLPTLRGFGALKDLHVSMSEDSDLLELVKDFVLDWSTLKFGDNAALDTEIRDILFTWAGVESVSTTSRGTYVDGQVLAFLEVLFDAPFYTTIGGGAPNPIGGDQASLVQSSFDYMFAHLKAQLLAQSGLQDLYS